MPGGTGSPACVACAQPPGTLPFQATGRNPGCCRPPCACVWRVCMRQASREVKCGFIWGQRGVSKQQGGRCNRAVPSQHAAETQAAAERTAQKLQLTPLPPPPSPPLPPPPPHRRHQPQPCPAPLQHVSLGEQVCNVQVQLPLSTDSRQSCLPACMPDHLHYFQTGLLTWPSFSSASSASSR
jgi:hypothetical protein